MAGSLAASDFLLHQGSLPLQWKLALMVPLMQELMPLLAEARGTPLYIIT